MTDTIDTPVEADLITVLSSALVAEVMENYFNKELHRTTKKIKVVDLQPQGSGYAFSLAFVKDAVHTEKGSVGWDYTGATVQIVPAALETATSVDYTVPTTPNGRDAKGKFTKKVKG